MHRAFRGGTGLAVAKPTDVVSIPGSLDHRSEQQLKNLVEALTLRRREQIDNIAE